MNALRHMSIAAILAAACLAGGCQSPVRPTPSVRSPAPPMVALVSVTGVVSEAAADPDGAPMPLAGATISFAIDAANLPLATVTDENGWYWVAQSKGLVTVTVTKEGYETLVKSIELTEDTVLNFELKTE